MGQHCLFIRSPVHREAPPVQLPLVRHERLPAMEHKVAVMVVVVVAMRVMLCGPAALPSADNLLP